MNGIPVKKINSRPQNWISLIKFVEKRQKSEVRLPYCNLYAYAANNPIHYIDPDGRTNVAITSTYKMNTENADGYIYNFSIINDSSSLFYLKGCAITAIANLASTLGLSLDPNDINTNTYVDSAGNVKWKDAASEFSLSVFVPTSETPFTYDLYDQQENDTANNYYTIIRVQYDSNPNDPHWVGVNGKQTVDGIDYFIISPTSVNDGIVGPNDLRGIQGWKKNSAGEILVPVDKVKDYRSYSKPVGE